MKGDLNRLVRLGPRLNPGGRLVALKIKSLAIYCANKAS